MASGKIEDDEFLTAEELSKLLKLHQKTIYKLAKKGIIPGRRVGKKWLFLKSEVIKVLPKTTQSGEGFSMSEFSY
jgi:excisionase family DNA binding protein